VEELGVGGWAISKKKVLAGQKLLKENRARGAMGKKSSKRFPVTSSYF